MTRTKGWTEEDLKKFNVKPVEKKINAICAPIEIRIGIPLPSLNQIYSGKHWSVRKKQIDVYHAVFRRELVRFKNYRLENFSVTLRYNAKIDPDNTVYGCKMLVDTLRELKILVNDTPEYYRGLHITPDPTLPPTTYLFTIEPNG